MINALALILTLATAASAQPQKPVVTSQGSGRFQIVNGTPDMARNIMLLDTQTGDTWQICNSEKDNDASSIDVKWCFVARDYANGETFSRVQAAILARKLKSETDDVDTCLSGFEIDSIERLINGNDTAEDSAAYQKCFPNNPYGERPNDNLRLRKILRAKQSQKPKTQ